MKKQKNKGISALLMIILTSSKVNAADVFDAEILKSIGYTESSVEYLSKKGNFPSGINKIEIITNNINKGIYSVNVNEQGKICWTTNILKSLNIDENALKRDKEGCDKLSPDIKVTKKVLDNNILMLVPITMMSSKNNYVTGGKAIIFNYDASAREYNSRGGNSSNKSLTSEIGANYKNWIFRSNQSYYSYGGTSNLTRLNNYIQRSFTSSKISLRLGQFTTGGDAFSGINITGVEISPESGLTGNSTTVNLKIYAPTAAQVDIYQRKALLKTVYVEAGTTTVEDIPILNQSDDFILSFIATSGETSRQVIPFIQADSIAILPEERGVNVYAGRLRMAKQDLPLAALSGNIYRNTFASFFAGGLASNQYQSIMVGGNFRFTEKSLLRTSTTSTQSLYTDNSQEKKRGIRNDISLNYKATSKISVSTAANFRSKSYMDFGSAGNSWYTAEDTGNIKNQLSLGLTYQSDNFGSISLNGSSTRRFKNTNVNSYSLNWGRNFNKINLNIGLQNNKFSNKKNNYNDNYLYVNASIPLGNGRSAQLYSNHSDRVTRYGATYNQEVNDKFNYDVSTETSSNKDKNINATGYYNSKYSRIAFGAAAGDSTKSYRAGMKGGVVLHENGLTFTPRQVSDTFGIVSINSKEPDVEIMTPAGKVWTDSQGQAIASSSAWRKNRIQVNVSSLKKNLEVQSGIAEVSPSRGSVVHVALPIYRVNRMLLSFDGPRVPSPGSAVLDSKGRTITFVSEDKTIFIDDLPAGVMTTTDSLGNSCHIDFPDKYSIEENKLYTPIMVRCLSEKK